jgi:rod shape determining protein RodA
MALGIVPVVGVPLPLVSYGGTSIITTFLSLGILLNIQARRFMLFY